MSVTIKCTSLYYRHPLAYIGKSNGRCDLWDCQLNLRLRSLVHTDPQTDRHLLITSILLTSNYLISLTSEGKLFVWDRLETEEVGDLELNKTDPVWTSGSLVRGNRIVSVFSDETKLVTVVVAGQGPAETSIVIYDFWHHRNNTSYDWRKQHRKRGFSNNSGSKKRASM